MYLNANPGVIVVEWTEEAIKIWHFPMAQIPPDLLRNPRRGDCCVEGRERQACFGRALPLSSAASGVAARGESAPVSAKGNFPEGGGPAGGASGKRGDVDSRAAATALPALLFNIIFRCWWTPSGRAA